MVARYTEARIRGMIAEADSRARKGRAERLRLLLSIQDTDPVPLDALAYEFFEEARLCWYVGARLLQR